MSRPLGIDLNMLQKKASLTKAFGQVTVTRDPDDKNGVVVSVQGWHGPQNAADHQKAEIFAHGKNSLEAIPELFEVAAAMANGGIEVEKGKTFEYEDRYTTRNKRGQEVTYHTGEDTRFPKGFYLDGVPHKYMR